MKRFGAVTVSGAMALALCLGSCGLSPTPFASRSEEPANVQTPTQPEPSPATPDQKQETTDTMQMESEPSEGLVAQGYAPESAIPVEVPDFNTEEYASVEETGFVSTQTSPLSTISADVDTASYANLRRMLKDGWKIPAKEQKDSDKKDAQPSDQVDIAENLDDFSVRSGTIPTGAVRIEEMVNYFDYDYAKPEGSDPFRITARMGRCPWNNDTELLVLGYATGDEDKSVADKGSNLVFLIDVSGSMDDPDKLPLLQSSFGELVSSLSDKDRVSIVTYSGHEEVVLEGAKGNDSTAIMRAIRGLKASGSTNGEAGLKTAYEIAEKNRIEGGVNRIVMASDGDLNVGMTSESDLHDFVDKQRDKGVYLSVLGFGQGNYKDNKMEILADHGNGSYHYIDCEAEAKRVFEQRLTANLVPFANDVKVQVEFNPAKIKGYRLIGYENRALADEDFKDDAKDAGEVGPRSQFSVLYEVVKADSPMEIPTSDLKYSTKAEQGNESGDWLTAKLRYKPASGGDVREQELVVSESEWSEDPGKDWRFAAAVGEFGMLLRDSEYKGSTTFKSIRDLVDAGDDATRKEFLELVNLAETN